MEGSFFYTRLPINLTENIWYPHNYKHPIDCVIKNFQADAKYTKAILSFSELQCMFNKNVESNSYEWAKMTLVQKK